MADLRSRFIEDYAGGLLNVSRQELASTGEVLSQDGFLSDTTAFVEDGTGTKSGLKLGVGVAESVDPTTITGLVNVRYADRTYTKIRDTKIFTTAMASAQAALAESVTESLSNIESAIDSLDISQSQTDGRVSATETSISTLLEAINQQSSEINIFRDTLRDQTAAAARGSFFPIGGIILWNREGNEPVPEGWQLCNGEQGSPNLASLEITPPLRYLMRLA